VKARKDLRKQKRADKKIKNMPVPKAMRPDHSFTAPKQANAQVNKKAINEKGSNLKRPIEEQKEETKKPSKKRKEGESNSLKKLSASNPLFYSLIESDNLISNYPGGTDTSDKAVEEDDLAIAMYEKKLGLDKKKKKSKEGTVKLGSAFEEDGLMDILDGLDEPQYEAPRKGAGISVSKKVTQAENEDSDGGSEDDDENSEDYSDDSDGDVNGYLDDLENGFNSEDESDDEDGLEDDEEDADFLDDDEEELEDSDINNDSDELDKFESDDEFLEIPDGEESSDLDEAAESDTSESALKNERNETTTPKNTQSKDETGAKAQTATAGKYVPPHLRGTATTKTEQQIRLHRALQGLLNKLSESNLESILMEIEKCYSNYPRHGKLR
jgi:nucleolar MIF4G domain-containing protein 1